MPRPDPHLAILEQAGLIIPVPAPPEGAYLFRHALMQDAAYASLLRADRRRLHCVVGETLEALTTPPPADLAPLLGYHFQAAGVENRARHYFTLAGAHALAGFANPEAARYYQAALALCAAPADCAPLLAGLGEARFRQSLYREAIDTWLEAIALYQPAGDLDAVARLYARAARAAWYGGMAPEGLALGRAGLAAVEAGPETPGLATLLHEVARACCLSGLVAAGHPLAWRALGVAERLGLVDLQAETLSTLGMFADGPPEPRLALLERAVVLTEDHHLPIIGWRAHMACGEVLKYLGRTREAQAHHWRSVLLSRQIGGGWTELFSLCNFLEVSLLRGEFAAVAAQVPPARALIPRDASGRIYRSRLAEIEAQLLRYQGDLAAAEPVLRFCITEARDQGYPESVAILTGLLAAILVEQGRFAEAHAVLAETTELSGQGLGDAVEPWCLLAAAEIGLGRPAAARQALATAAARNTRMAGVLSVGHLALATARLAAHAGDQAAAAAAFAQAAAAHAAMDRPWFHAQILLEWAGVEAAAGTPAGRDGAAAHLRAAHDQFAALGVPRYAALAAARLDELRITD